jgi:predicted permease
MIAFASAALTTPEREVWYVILGLGLVVVLVVIALLLLLLSFVADIRESVGGLLVGAGAIAANTANIPKLADLPPVLDLVLEEGVVLDKYMNALSQGYSTEG